MAHALGFGALFALLGAASALGGGPAGQRIVAATLALGANAVPLLLPAEPAVVRSLAALIGVWGFGRVLELVRMPGVVPAVRRWVHVFAVEDSSRLARRRPGLDHARLGGLAAYGLLTAGAVYTTGELASTFTGPAHWTVRWTGAAAFVYGAAEVVTRLLEQGYATLGIHIDPIQRRPIRARSLHEFWGMRWNRIVHEALHTHLFTPWHRRGRPWLGLVAAFGTSAVLHFWVFFVGLGWELAALMASYFVVQGALQGLERLLRLGLWPAPAAHAWTLLAVALPSPLFLEPLIRMVE